MINEKFLLLTAIVATGFLHSMQPPKWFLDLTPTEIGSDANIHRALISEVALARSMVDMVDSEFEIPIDLLLADEILLVGPDVTTPSSELGILTTEELDKEFKKMLEANVFGITEADFANFREEEHGALRKVIKQCVWQDESCRGSTTIKVDNYLATLTDEETKRRCIAHILEDIIACSSFVAFHMDWRLIRAKGLAAGHNELNDDDARNIARGLMAPMFLVLSAAGEKTERAVLTKLGLSVPSAPIDYAVHIAKAKQMLEKISQQ